MALVVDIFPARNDNYGYLVHDPETGATAAIDAPEEGPIRAALERRGWTLTDILVTHHHIDHVEALAPLKAAFPDVAVTGPAGDAAKIEGLDRTVRGGDTVRVGNVGFEVIDVPGHTLGHIAYYAPDGGHLFAADALFSLGVGRMFEGDAGGMWAGLERLRALPDETLVYCGHEYTESNARFALSVDPDNPVLQARAAEVALLRRDGNPTIPSRLGEEKAANPFLRADDPGLAARMGLSADDPAAVFGALRKAKDEF